MCLRHARAAQRALGRGGKGPGTGWQPLFSRDVVGSLVQKVDDLANVDVAVLQIVHVFGG